MIRPAVALLDAAPNGEMQTTDMILALEQALHPKGEDTVILDGRSDSKFSQKVRNLKSHETLEKRGLAIRIPGGFRITPAGRSLAREAMA